ncbi:protein of unknown function [Pseudorhizobium banfieldiae]|uniref:Uncharacterized protein n=1 Tax=Pseudorhizobium banfieldiae TaxID=1125847 RepID=L0NIQ8_9HYPH|nr:protein of unknown function [Pseudorhizobium banfieldiae]
MHSRRRSTTSLCLRSTSIIWNGKQEAANWKPTARPSGSMLARAGAIRAVGWGEGRRWRKGLVFQAFRLPRLHILSEIVPAFPAVLTAVTGAEP